MTEEQWLQLKQEFELARDASNEIRSRVLAKVDNEEVRRELAELLRAYDSSSEAFLERPALLNGAFSGMSQRPCGQRLGSYLLVRQVGEGGMGVVYEATRADGEFEQRVAIKIVKLWLTSDRETARFRTERQILARLDHPNIARLLDGGTTPDGLPFLVMEFVDGIRVDEHSRQCNLDVPCRLQLFRQVCEAVGYAHSQGIVHRDLKPANILVVGNGRPKLLDFGIAKVVDADLSQAATITLARPATPQYASPEQLRGEPTTPATDIYSLGVLLYELLTERSPYSGKTRDLSSIARAVYEEEPRPPSEVTGNRNWKRNLDRIVASSMQKDPGARYVSVADLIADVDRYLTGAAVQGRPSGAQLSHPRRLFWAAAVLLLAFAGLWIGDTHIPFLRPKSAFEQLYAQGLERQQHFDWPAARSLFRRAVDADPRNPLGHYVYSAALETLGYESLAQREAKLAKDLSSGLSTDKQALIRGRYQEYKGDRAGAVATYKELWSLNRKSVDYGLRLAAAQRNAGAPADALHILDAIANAAKDPADRARINLEQARSYELLSKYQQELVDAQAAADTADRISVRQLKAEALQIEGDALREMNRFEEAVKIYADAEALAREDGDLYEVASIENRLGGMYFNRGDYSALEAHSNTALALFRQIDNKTAQSSILNNLSLVMKSPGDLSGALNMLEQALAIARASEDLHAQSRELTNMGTILRRLGREQEARKAFEGALECARRIGDRDQIARSHITLETLDRDNGNLSGALDHVRTALNSLADSKALGLKSLVWQHLGDDLHAGGDIAGAKSALEQSLAVAQQANSKQLMADDAFMLADIVREQGEFARGEELLHTAEAYYVAEKQKVNLWDAWVVESRLQIAENRAAASDRKITEAVDGFQKVKDDARKCTGYAALIESYLAQRKTTQASRALAASRTVCSSTPEYDSRMIYTIRALQVRMALGDSGRPKQELQSLARELDAKHWGGLAQEARRATKLVARTPATM